MADISSSIKPTWELHDLNNNPEHDLMESYLVEFTDISGIQIWYYQRDEQKIEIDDIYGEPKYQNIEYKSPRLTKLIYDVTEEPTMTTGFGINSEDIIQFASTPKFTWSRDVSGVGMPKPGDVIQTIWNDRSYEIADVHEEENIFQLRKFVWNLILRPYRFSEQSDSAEAIATRFGTNGFEDFDGEQITMDPTDPHINNTLSAPVSAFGNNPEIESESDGIDVYSDVDTGIYGY